MATVLCESCLSLFNRSEPSGRDLPHHHSLDELRAATQKCCKICTILYERVVITGKTRSDVSIRAGYTKASLTFPSSAEFSGLSFSVFPPAPGDIERHDRYGIRYDKLAEFWVIRDADDVRLIHTFSPISFTYTSYSFFVARVLQTRCLL
jgi:hypothetical protein